MLYTRASFINYLQEVHKCDIIPLKDGKGVRIKYMNESCYFNMTGTIDYDEVYLYYQKLLLPYLPGDSDLERVED